MLRPNKFVTLRPLFLRLSFVQLDVIKFDCFTHFNNVSQRVQNLFILVREVNLHNLRIHVFFDDVSLFGVSDSVLDLHPDLKFHLDFIVVKFERRGQFLHSDSEVSHFYSLHVELLGEVLLHQDQNIQEHLHDEKRENIDHHYDDCNRILRSLEIGAG